MVGAGVFAAFGKCGEQRHVEPDRDLVDLRRRRVGVRHGLLLGPTVRVGQRPRPLDLVAADAELLHEDLVAAVLRVFDDLPLARLCFLYNVYHRRRLRFCGLIPIQPRLAFINGAVC